jgi:hypothetical protein
MHGFLHFAKDLILPSFGNSLLFEANPVNTNISISQLLDKNEEDAQGQYAMDNNLNKQDNLSSIH